MVSLFQGLCAAAGLTPEKATASAPRASSPRPRPTPTISAARGQTKAASKVNQPRQPSGLPPALAGLLESLPSPDEGWTNEQRQKFMTTFGAVLDFCIPIVKRKPEDVAA
jgi:hypothetical protein